MRAPMPTKKELLACMETLEVALSSMMRRWNDDIPAETRAEIMIAYEPLLHMLIRARRRGQTRHR